MTADERAIAERLGVPQEAVRRVQRHGLLQRFELDDREVRRRLWQGHVAFVRRHRGNWTDDACSGRGQ
jgi:hypothetical protein